MNVIELRDELEKAQESVRELSALALGGFYIGLEVDQQWNVSTNVNPTLGDACGKGVIHYENLWTNVTPAMSGKVSRHIKDISLTLEGRLLQASASIQKDILATDHGGILAFWRSGKKWLTPQLHRNEWYSESPVLFVDAFDNYGVPEAFITSHNLADMRLSYQADFICSFWPCFNVNDEKSMVYNDGQPPHVDKDSANNGVIFS